MLSISDCFCVSENDNLDKIYALLKILNYLASVLREYLLFKTRDVIDESNTELLKRVADMHKRIRNLVEK